ncbi:hypothetical protein SBC1_49120 (plasmid) [Caballeronia sp. SBC1]|uniref:DUF4148 domain-containing protein n=1 Tax=unclassified Caballeronia TaxID=2646786 RepID=UPI0013E1802D|nr:MULTISPECIES: DUF4148 domain-containing protein [unclassified Caballeronia]QIE25815.1 hypothetical protein SBC2_38850 [Caballeronia sp. SBC2]QIN64872.1 hypothetical protein SBC1_49120 [Caballeronia sp. SBC1]
MKSFFYAAIAASTLTIPVVSFAQQSNAPVTRAQVRTELIQVEQAGYNPGRRDPNYPDDIQAAQARVAAAQAQTNSYGPAVGGSSQSGQPPGQ